MTTRQFYILAIYATLVLLGGMFATYSAITQTNRAAFCEGQLAVVASFMQNQQKPAQTQNQPIK